MTRLLRARQVSDKSAFAARASAVASSVSHIEIELLKRAWMPVPIFVLPPSRRQGSDPGAKQMYSEASCVHLQIGSTSGGCFGRDRLHSLMIGCRDFLGQNLGAPMDFRQLAFQ